jgi:hypothetical protein
MNELTPASQLVRKRQLATLMSVSPRTIDGWVSKRMIPFIEPNPRLHLFDPVAVKSALLAQFAVPANIPEDVAIRAGVNN